MAGWGAWGVFVSVAARAARDGGASVTALWGWSFWLYTGALAAATLGGCALCCT